MQSSRIQRDIPMLETLHIVVLEVIQYMQDLKKKNKRDETYYLNDELTKLYDLNCLIFKIHAEIQKNLQIRFRN